MRRTPFSAALFALAAVALLLAPRAESQRPTPPPHSMVQTKPRIATSLTVDNVAGQTGETVKVHARLRAAAGPPAVSVEGREVRFTLQRSGPDQHMGSAKTDGEGRVELPYKVPILEQGSYTIAARFHGDTSLLSSKGEAKLTAIKAITKIEVLDFKWKNRPTQGSSPYGDFKVKLYRTSDNWIAEKWYVHIFVNDVEQRTVLIYSPSEPAWVPLGTCLYPPPWRLRVQFNGDGAHAASAFSTTYN